MSPKAQKRITYAAIALPILFVIGVVVTRIFFYDFHRVPSWSMYPSIPEHSFIVVDKWGYGNYSIFGVPIARRPVTSRIARGDIFVHQLPDDSRVVYVKRIVAVPGDRIEYVDNRMTVNGTPAVYTEARTERTMNFAVETIGDVNIPIAWDGTRGATDYLMVVPPDHYVVFGDNRNNAKDSRFIGTIAKELLVGRVVRIFPPKEIAQ